MVRAASIQYSVVVVVVCRPELSACEISPVCALACGTSRFTRVLLPEPEGPSTSLYWIDDERSTALIDSPGFQEFGLRHLASADLAHCMPDIAAHAGACRFYNCTHLHEPGCAVMAQVREGQDAQAISPQRHRIYAELFAELSQSPY